MAISGTFITKHYFSEISICVEMSSIELACPHSSALSQLPVWDFQNLGQFKNLQTISGRCYPMVKDQKMAFTDRYWPKCIQIYFICVNQISKNSHPSETAVDEEVFI